MKNIEKYFNEICKELENYGIACALDRVKSGRESACTKLECECRGCSKDALKWLISESALLSRQEYEILNNIPKKWKYIARDSHFGDEEYGQLYIYTSEPEKGEYEWIESGTNENDEHYRIKLFEDLFRFITWESKAYSIEELLKEYEAQYGK